MAEFNLTAWGYEVEGPVPLIVPPDVFEDATGGRWTGDMRTDAALASASTAVRNACGWHIGPNLSCRATLDVDRPTKSLWLPARNVTDVTSVKVDGAEVTGYQWSRLGQIVMPSVVPCGLRKVVVEYRAGLCTHDMAALVAGLASRSLALSMRPGVTSESAGGVSVSVAAGVAAASPAPYLTDVERAQLAPHKVVRAHAT